MTTKLRHSDDSPLPATFRISWGTTFEVQVPHSRARKVLPSANHVHLGQLSQKVLVEGRVSIQNNFKSVLESMPRTFKMFLPSCRNTPNRSADSRRRMHRDPGCPSAVQVFQPHYSCRSFQTSNHTDSHPSWVPCYGFASGIFVILTCELSPIKEFVDFAHLHTCFCPLVLDTKYPLYTNYMPSYVRKCSNL